MVDKNIIKKKLNDRLTEIDIMVDELIPNDYIKTLKQKYNEELEYHEYIDSVEVFSVLTFKGSMRYINKFDKKLRYGGLLVKIYQKNGHWYAIIKKPNETKYYVSFDSNYIFYCENLGEIQNNNFRNCLDFFISDFENDKYEIY